MTPKQQTLHGSLIKQLHISKRYKEYYKENKEEYQELLQRHFGMNSSKELSIDQLIVFADYMNFKRDTLPEYKAEICTKAQLSTMRGLWNSFASTPTDEALLKFVNRNRGKEYTELHMISKSDAQKVIPVLKTMSKNIIIC
ncbi:MAG: DUF1018 domain-containing protein [Campylobacterales bacterium]|nr:DUF1018 domain-containing protein [Campylobacterales bacterium]